MPNERLTPSDPSVTSSEVAGFLNPANVLTRKIQGIVDSIRRERILEHESGEDVYPEIIPGELPVVETTIWQEEDLDGDWMDISNRKPYFQ